MTLLRLLAVLGVFAFAACSAPRTIPAGEPESRSYPYAATSAADGAFSYAQLGGKNSFEWKTLTLDFNPRTYHEGNAVVFLIDIDVKNRGAKPFAWDELSPYLAVPDEAGEWNYRLLFTQSKTRALAPGASARLRYYTRLDGQAAPNKYVFVLQSLFGGLDAGFPFVAATTAN